MTEMCVFVTQSCLTLYNPLDCSPPGSSVHGILQARRLEWVAIPFSRYMINIIVNSICNVSFKVCISLVICVSTSQNFPVVFFTLI